MSLGHSIDFRERQDTSHVGYVRFVCVNREPCGFAHSCALPR